jgi:hypothetical protein
MTLLVDRLIDGLHQVMSRELLSHTRWVVYEGDLGYVGPLGSLGKVG